MLFSVQASSALLTLQESGNTTKKPSPAKQIPPAQHTLPVKTIHTPKKRMMLDYLKCVF